MKKMYVLLVFLAASGGISAQNFSVVGDTANLGAVYENAPDSVLVHLVNSGNFAVVVDEVFGFPFYGDTVVVGSLMGTTINAGDSLAIWVKAQPEHNVKHKGILLVKMADSPYGSAVLPYSFQGKYSKAYYNATENKTEAALRTQLQTTIGFGYTSLSYNSARDEMYGDIDNVNGDVECVYTGRVATFSTRAGATSNGFNCEHTWPQSLFSENLPMKSDIHHLFPTDDAANSQRGNLPFGVVTNPTWSVGGSKKNSTTFEPRDAQKGATARAMMYFVVRYQDYSNFFVGQQSILRQWHSQFLPSAAEQQRNQDIFALQNNRNPFVDYPQFAERITSLVGTTTTPTNAKLFVCDDTIKMVQDAASSSKITYVVNIYNYGNTDVSLSNFSLSNPALHFVGTSGNNVVLSANKNHAVAIEYPLATNFTGEELTFQTTAPGMFNVTVPIQSKSIFGIKTNTWQPEIIITNAAVSWAAVAENFTWKLVDVAGRTVKSGNEKEQVLSFSGLKTGVYFLHMQSASGLFSAKIFVPNL